MAAPVKGNRKQSTEGDALDPPASPKPAGKQNGIQNPISLELTCGRSTKQWRSWGPMSW
ncbi:ARID5A isoform 4 [Pan troglodytes]|uniref:AT-rich interaction domain 5A n=2 Tax=Homininae TaxID=207598 RepID=F6Q9D3_HUMAN|nr:AT-rich interaction domain 5A [Homo sapiens]KAI4035486.1 AT-rich interaction domain 5A [Homo sapiens]PNI88868.1 ARID5A isoform 4 [Pan troglodytes]